jgi:YbbR domain-containing protein
VVDRSSAAGDLINRAGTILLALILAIIVWLVSANQENPSVKDTFPDPIQVEVRNKPAGMVVFGELVDRTQVIIRAPRSSWDNLRAGSFQAWIDLTGLDADIHDVEVQVKCSDRAVQIVDKKPSKIAVRLEVLKQKQMDVKTVVVDSPPLGYIYRTPTVTPARVTVRGPGSVVDQVTSVVADIYLQGAKSDLAKAVALLPHDAQGEVVAWAELDPPRADVNVPIEQRIGYKDASVRVILKGQVARGYRITNVSVDPSVVTVVGGPISLSNIAGYLETKPIDVTDAKADVVERATLPLPEGVSLLGTQSVQVTVSVLPLEGGLTLQGLPLTWQGLAPDMVAKASPDAVDVILSGPLPRLEPLKRDEVQVIMDVYGLAPGVHKIAPTVVVPEGLKAESVLPDMVEVQIEPKLVPAPTQTVRPTSPPTVPAPISPIFPEKTPPASAVQ